MHLQTRMYTSPQNISGSVHGTSLLVKPEFDKNQIPHKGCCSFDYNYEIVSSKGVKTDGNQWKQN